MLLLHQYSTQFLYLLEHPFCLEITGLCVVKDICTFEYMSTFAVALKVHSYPLLDDTLWSTMVTQIQGSVHILSLALQKRHPIHNHIKYEMSKCMCTFEF